MPCLRTHGSMDPTADRLHEKSRPSAEIWDVGVSSEYERPTHLSYAGQAHRIRGTSSGSKFLPAAVLTVLAVVHLLVLCFYNKRFEGRSGDTARSLAGGDRPCQGSADSGDFEGRGDSSAAQSYEPREQPLAGEGTYSEAYGEVRVESVAGHKGSYSVQERASHDRWTEGSGEPPVQPFPIEGPGVPLPYYGRGGRRKSIRARQGTLRHSTTSSQAPEVDTQLVAYGAPQIPPSGLPEQSPSVSGQASGDSSIGGSQRPPVPSDRWRTEGHETPSAPRFGGAGADEHLPSYGERHWSQSARLSEGTVYSPASSADTLADSGGFVRSSRPSPRRLPRHQHIGENQPVASEEAGSECRLLPAEVMERLVSFFSDSIGTVRKCSSLLPRLSSLHGRRLTWMVLRLATLDMAALARVPRSIQVHRRELGRAMYGLALELCSYSQNTETPDTLFIQQLQIFAQLIQDIQCTWGAATSLPPHKNAIQVEANLAVSETARKYYGNAVDGLLWLTETLSAVQVAPLVEQHLRVLEALCNMRAVQVSRETASRQLIFHFQKLRGSRPLIDLGFLTPQDMTVLPVQYTCAELSRVVARGGGIFIPPQMNPGLAAMPPWTPSSGPHMQATDEFQGTSGSTEMHRKGSGSTELSETVTEQEAHAELSETVTEQEAHKARSGTPSTSLSPSASTRSQSGTPSASLSPSRRARRWSRQRHRNTQAKPSPGESPSAGP